MHRNIFLFFLLFFFCSSLFAQQLSDEQVVEYVIQAQSQGKTQREIVTELMRRGITREQAERIQTSYHKSSEKEKDSFSENRERTLSDSRVVARSPEVEKESRLFTSSGEPGSVSSENKSTPAVEYLPVEDEPGRKIYGHNIFRNPKLSFEPNANLATPANYQLGPGDEVIIDVWGASENTIRQTISPEGSIMVTNLGPVYLSGMTVKEANNYLQRELGKIYSGITGDAPSSEVLLTLGNIRTIQINVMGEVAVPGTYRLSSFATVFHALYKAGGINPIGSLREIKVMRNGKLLTTVDIYEYILSGKMNDDVRLMEGDFIIVSPYCSLVEIMGKVKRPMFYEMKPGETLGSLIEYAGGFTGEAYKENVRLIRKGKQEHEVFTVEKGHYYTFNLTDGDEISVDSVLNRYQNRIEIRGAVYRPGVYQLGESVRSVKELIEKADGLRGDAFLNRAVLHREKEDYSLEVLPINLRELLGNQLQDVVLKNNDILYIPSLHDLQEQPVIVIHGEVANPGTYFYADNTTLEDMVLQAGGLLESAATIKVEISRRIKSPRSTYVDSTLGESFVFELKDGLVVTGVPGFVLQPFDEVYVRKSPAYQVQRNVYVNGEVLFEGSYALTSKNERISDLILKSGGLTSDAYVNGARLIRKMNDAEIARQQATLKMANKGADSISVSSLDISNTYNVGIELGKALRYPGSDYDLVLRDGDRLEVPEYLNTVQINGAVMYPNTTLYKQHAKLKYYINRAGGYGARAKKNRAYVVNMNGTVSRVKRWKSSAIQPGSEIIVPVKPERKGGSMAETLSIATSTASLAAMVATIVNIVK